MPEIQETLPKYLQIANFLRDQILRGDLHPGDEVPSERALVTQWNVSRPTAARALDALRQQGLVEKRQGSGTYVTDVQIHRRARERYGRARQLGKIYAPGEYAVISSTGMVDAPDYVVRGLGLSQDVRQAIHRRRVTNNEGGPVEVSTSWFAPGLAESAPLLLIPERIRQGTLAYVEDVTGRRGMYGEDRVCARLASGQEASELGMEQPAAVMVVRHTVYDEADRPLEFAEAVYPQGRWAFEREYPLG
ncbi:GntR family transcriptional regulator [Yinghuangia sp. ASG 101]|uniref:GntR family transcriptional regulator n=1 Tax=Yinghuangia sp. ASG 101 TaxID=2896848 RepID=UPI001E2E8F19|nr:GntR family transcriptional regulator [Yinghuangia sp. ASG 101]UGQ15128.1 GntR family transcriptional regulator [Yinghuangia sp. ASG 101]